MPVPPRRLSRLLSSAAAATVAFVALLGPLPTAAQEAVFGVVTNLGRDGRPMTAQVLIGGTVSELSLIPTESVADNPIWKKLEKCHSLRLEGTRSGDGYRISGLRVLDAGMLPMALQGIAGDCLLRKAMEIAPLVD